MRTLLGPGIPGTMDICQGIMVLMIFAPLTYVEKTGGHIRISTLTSRLSKRANLILQGFITNIVMIITFGLMAFTTLRGIIESYKSGETSWGEFTVPLWIPKAVIFLGVITFLIYIVIVLFIIVLGQTETKKNSNTINN
jgi:TRAP-type C4-dicarboxylate transport system permease small subunit